MGQGPVPVGEGGVGGEGDPGRHDLQAGRRIPLLEDLHVVRDPEAGRLQEVGARLGHVQGAGGPLLREGDVPHGRQRHPDEHPQPVAGHSRGSRGPRSSRLGLHEHPHHHPRRHLVGHQARRQGERHDSGQEQRGRGRDRDPLHGGFTADSRRSHVGVGERDETILADAGSSR